MSSAQKKNCPDCQSKVDRRGFLATTGGALAAASAAPLLGSAVSAAPSTAAPSTALVSELYASLSDTQKKQVCLPFAHEARRRISANWHVTKPEFGDDFYNDAHRDLVSKILKSITSEDGYKRLVHQMDDDNGGLDYYSMAIFGEPGSDQFEWVMTGRHLTLRADGNSNAHTAFGGPLVYGHGEENPKDNMFFAQTKKANEVFQALDPAQSKQALLKKAPKENAVRIQGEQGNFPGIQVGSLQDDQKELVQDTLQFLLAPYREEDVKEVMEIVKAGGGLDKLHMAFFREGDLENDQVWDMWRVEGPSFVWHFRGAPHVHAYINIQVKA